MILAVSLVILLFASDASCQTVVTYSSKSSEELLCPITDGTVTAAWNDETTGNNLASYVKGGQPDIEIVDPGSKHNNFMYSVSATSFSIFIQDVQKEDGGVYVCTTVGGGGSRTEHTVVVEVIPGTFSLNCFVPPDVTCPEQSVLPTSELICVCAANGVRPGTLYLDIPDAYNVQQNESIENGNLFDLRLKATVPVTESMSEDICSVKGYNTSEAIPSELITTTFMISPPTCSLDISFDQECKVATLTCSCSASPTDGEPPSVNGIVYSYFNGTGHIIVRGTSTTAHTNDVAAGAVNTFSCRGCNGLYYGDSSYVTNSSECTITTESTTEKSGSTTTEKSVPPPSPWVIILSSAAALVVCGCGVLIIICLYKKGKCCCKSESSSVTDVKVTATNSHTTNSEPAPAPVYGEIKKDRKKKSSNSGKGIENDGMDPPTDYAEVKMKSDKLDDNGAGPRGDPEIPAYGVVDKNRTKDPTPAPRSSMRDSTNPSKPKQDGQMEMQYADLDHGNKPPSDEVRKPKEEPTEYATVQSVIV